MRFRVITVLTVAILCLAPVASWADLAPYSQDFELLGTGQEDPAALADDGWLVWANVFGPDWAWWYGYPSATPNGGSGYCGVDAGQGGPEQGDRQLVVYNDYNNGNHGDGTNAIIEANVFQEQTIGAADVGSTWRFEFDAKRGNIEPASMAGAFFKTLDANFALTNYIPIDMTGIPDTWGTYSVSIFIDPSLEGQKLQFGFINWASRYEGSGIFYDNLDFGPAPLGVHFDIKPGSCRNPINPRSQGRIPVALLGTADFDITQIDVATVRLEGVAPVDSSYEDVATPFLGELCGCTEAGADGFEDLTLKFNTQELIDALGVLPTGDLQLTLSGALHDGTLIEGLDCVVPVGRQRPKVEVDRRHKDGRPVGMSRRP
jgi:hypothetical protein